MSDADTSQGPEDTEALVDSYACYSEPQLSRVLQLLDEAEIDYLVRDRESSAFPTNVGTTSEKVIAVRSRDRSRVHQIVNDAVADEVISSDGRLITD